MKDDQKSKEEYSVKPPSGLIPRKIYERQINEERFHNVCDAITRYYDAGLKINLDWIIEYNNLIDKLNEK